MKEGIIIMHKNTLHLLVYKPRQRIILIDKMPVEIHMGSCWIEGTLQFNANIPNDCVFVCKNSQSFCGIREGMRIRILEESE